MGAHLDRTIAFIRHVLAFGVVVGLIGHGRPEIARGLLGPDLLKVDLYHPFSHNVAMERNQRWNAPVKWRMFKTREEKSGLCPRAGSVLLRWATRSALILGALFVAALLLIHIPQTQALILASLTHRLESETEVGFTCKGFWWFPFMGVHVRDLDVRAAGRSVLECREASLDFDLSFVRPWLVPGTLRLDSPVLQLQKVDGRFMIFPKAVRKGGAGAKIEGPEQTGAGIMPTRARLLNIEIHSGVIVGEQNGVRVLEIKGVDGSLILKGDGEVKGPFLNLDPFKNRG